jgi:hypothetical protein
MTMVDVLCAATNQEGMGESEGKPVTFIFTAFLFQNNKVPHVSL